jgi:hypothetical protein
VSGSSPPLEFLRCDHCGDSIGVYDPFCWQRPDGSVTETAFLDMRDEPEREHPASRFFHPLCLRAAAGTAS